MTFQTVQLTLGMEQQLYDILQKLVEQSDALICGAEPTPTMSTYLYELINYAISAELIFWHHPIHGTVITTNAKAPQ